MEAAEVKQVIETLTGSVWAFSALKYAAEAGMLEHLSEPRTATYISERTRVPAALAERVLDVLVSLHLLQRQGDTFTSDKGLLALISPASKNFFLASLRANYLESRHFIDSAQNPGASIGWNFTEPAILQSQGMSSASGVEPALISRLGDLEQRLRAPSARFLDVGAGVGAISIAVCRLLPNLHAVGLEPQEAPLAEARRNVAGAGLADRIELRKQGVEDLTDKDAFDLAFFPQMFMSDRIVTLGLQNIWKALRPGGWILVTSLSIEGMNIEAALSRLRDVLWGGAARLPSQVEALLSGAGFTSVMSFGSPYGATLKVIAGRRPV